MDDRDANISHEKKDLAKIKWFWTCKVEAPQGTKWNQQPAKIREGYITKLRGVAIYYSLDGERFTMFKFCLDYFPVQSFHNFLFCETMAQQWPVRRRLGNTLDWKG